MKKLNLNDRLGTPYPCPSLRLMRYVPRRLSRPLSGPLSGPAARNQGRQTAITRDHQQPTYEYRSWFALLCLKEVECCCHYSFVTRRPQLPHPQFFPFGLFQRNLHSLTSIPFTPASASLTEQKPPTALPSLLRSSLCNQLQFPRPLFNDSIYQHCLAGQRSINFKPPYIGRIPIQILHSCRISRLQHSNPHNTTQRPGTEASGRS